jgi:hypothetical protein
VLGWLALLVMADAAAVTRIRSGKSRTSGRTDAWFLATDRLPLGEQQQLEQRGLDRATCRVTVEVCFLPGGLGVIEAL